MKTFGGYYNVRRDSMNYLCRSVLKSLMFWSALNHYIYDPIKYILTWKCYSIRVRKLLKDCDIITNNIYFNSNYFQEMFTRLYNPPNQYESIRRFSIFHSLNGRNSSIFTTAQLQLININKSNCFLHTVSFIYFFTFFVWANIKYLWTLPL